MIENRPEFETKGELTNIPDDINLDQGKEKNKDIFQDSILRAQILKIFDKVLIWNNLIEEYQVVLKIPEKIDQNLLTEIKTELEEKNLEGNFRFESVLNTDDSLKQSIFDLLRELNFSLERLSSSFKQDLSKFQDSQDTLKDLENDAMRLEQEVIQQREVIHSQNFFKKLVRKSKNNRSLYYKDLEKQKKQKAVEDKTIETNRTLNQIKNDYAESTKINLKLFDLYQKIREAKKTPQIIGKSINESLENKEDISQQNFLMIHCSEYPPIENAAGNLEIKSSAYNIDDSGRYTIHTTINHPVYSHMAGNWDNPSFIYFMPCDN